MSPAEVGYSYPTKCPVISAEIPLLKHQLSNHSDDWPGREQATKETRITHWAKVLNASVGQRTELSIV